METNKNITEDLTIDWQNDSFILLIAKRTLQGFLNEQKEFKGKSTERIDEYHNRRISELREIIKNENNLKIICK
jgi:hypothetical protein